VWGWKEEFGLEILGWEVGKTARGRRGERGIDLLGNIIAALHNKSLPNVTLRDTAIQRLVIVPPTIS
jgi:hypothetical protein